MLAPAFPFRLLRHCRFTFAEFRANRGKVGAGTAGSYFRMRALSPFGIGKGWQRGGSCTNPDVARLRESGFCALPSRPAAEVEALIGLFLAAMRDREQVEFESLQAYFDHARATGSERPDGVFTTGQDALSTLLRDPALVALAADYLQLPPERLVGNANMDPLIRTAGKRPESAYDNALRFHRDIDSYRFLKMFVYLTDSRLGDGHHEIYLNSHRHHPVRLGPIQRYEAEDIERLIPQARLQQVQGQAGCMFAEDTFAFHRGTVPTGRDRLICNLQYMDDTFKDIGVPNVRVV